MKNTEFRLLNYVEYLNWSENGTPAYFMIRDIYRDEGKVSLSNGAIMLPSPSMDMIKPIPLTEEWLLKFGFTKHKPGIGGADMWHGMDAWSIGNSEWLFRGSPNNGLKLVGYINSNILYVHQLQNLYFALTQTELVITNSPNK